MQRPVAVAAVCGLSALLCGLIGFSPAKADYRDDQIRTVRAQIHDQSDDVRREERLLRDMERRRNDYQRHHAYRDADNLNDRIDDLRRHIDSDRRRLDRLNERLHMLQDRRHDRDRYGDIDWRDR